jgi:hypothetical protein
MNMKAVAYATLMIPMWNTFRKRTSSRACDIAPMRVLLREYSVTFT